MGGVQHGQAVYLSQSQREFVIRKAQENQVPISTYLARLVSTAMNNEKEKNDAILNLCNEPKVRASEEDLF